MTRILVLLAQLTAVLFVNLFTSGDVSMQMDAPAQFNAGQDIQVTITVRKGEITSFSRFLQELPPGLTASAVHSANADFSFENQRVRLVWLRLPGDEEMSFTYTIHVNERLKGSFPLTGRFSYIENNQRKSVDIAQRTIAIVPSTTINPALIVDIADFGRAATPSITTQEATRVACIRQTPVRVGNDYLVSLLVHKGNQQKFAKIEETIPEGYIALNVESKDGIFTFKDNTVKYLWMNLPAEEYFVVQYKLVPTGTPAPGPLQLAGNFSYIDGEKTHGVDVQEKQENLSNLSRQDIAAILAAPMHKPTTTTSTLVADAVKPVIPRPDQTVNNQQVTTTTPNNQQQTVTTTNNQVVRDPGTTRPTGDRDVTQGRTDVLAPESGIYYRVQIAAGHKPVNTRRYFRKFEIQDQVITEQHEGWHKYSVGMFKQYKDARDYRVHIWNTTPIQDAFVAAYNGGQRVTVQEALMIANQRWYR